MQILKILILVLGLAVVAFAAKVGLTGSVASNDPGRVTEPKRQLDDVRRRAAELETELQKKADRASVDR